MNKNNQEILTGITNFEKNEEISAWEALDEVVRKWAVMSGHEKDMENYEKLRQMY